MRLNLRQYRSARCELNINIFIPDISLSDIPDDATRQEKLELIHQTIRRTVVKKSKYAEIYKKVGLNEMILIPLYQ